MECVLSFVNAHVDPPVARHEPHRKRDRAAVATQRGEDPGVGGGELGPRVVLGEANSHDRSAPSKEGVSRGRRFR